MRPLARRPLLVLSLFVAIAASAGPEDDRLKALEAKSFLTKSEVKELVGYASRGGHDAVAVGRRYDALRILSKHPVPPEVGDRLASRLAVRGGEGEDFVRVLVPGIIEASGTNNFLTHIALAKQINAGGPPQLMNGSLKALEALGPTDPVVAELLAATALNTNHRVDVRQKALALAASLPAEPGKGTSSLEGTLFQAARDPHLKDTAIEALRTRTLSDEARMRLHTMAGGTGPDAAMASAVLQARNESKPDFSVAPTGRFVDLGTCKGYLESVTDDFFRRARQPPASTLAGARR